MFVVVVVVVVFVFYCKVRDWRCELYFLLTHKTFIN